VLQSTKKDNVFVNFVDHGGVDIIGFPEGAEPSVMHSKELIQALTTANQKGLFRQLVFYLEACESGSMFEKKLPSNINIYAITAANAKESSWGTYCPGGMDAGKSADMVDGKHLQTCLGDLFSVNWMQDVEGTLDITPAIVGGLNETLQDQYGDVKIATNKSHVMQYGDVSWAKKEKVSGFEAALESFLGQPPMMDDQPKASLQEKLASAVPSRDIPLHLASHRFTTSHSAAASQELAKIVTAQQATQKIEEALASKLPGADLTTPLRSTVQFAGCHVAAVREFDATCGFNEHNMKVSALLYRLCEHAGEDAMVLNAVSAVCKAQ